MTIKELLLEKRRNLDGQEYNLFDAKNREKEANEFATTLGNYLCAVMDNIPNAHHEAAKNHFYNTIKNLSVIRMDATGMKTEPHLSSVAEFISEFMKGRDRGDQINQARDYIMNNSEANVQKFINKKGGDATTYAVRPEAGIRIFAPVLKTAQSPFSKTSEIEAEKIFIHEFIHASSAWINKQDDGTEKYVQGVDLSGKGEGVYDDFNEGLTEYFALKIMKNIYPNQKIKTGYGDRVNMVSSFMDSLTKEEQEFMFESYVNGRGNEILSFFESNKDKNNNSIKDYLDMYESNGLGLEGGVGKDGKNYQLFGHQIQGCLNSAERVQ